MENDFLMFSKEPEIMNAIHSEKILYSNKIQKMKSFLLKQERNLIVTQSAIYTFQNKKLKKTLKYEEIKALTFSTISNEFIIHRKNQYDFHYLCPDKIKLICAIIKAYEKSMNTPLVLCEIKEKSLKPYVTTKKEKKRDANASRMDKNKIIDTQTFLIDHEQKKILARSQTAMAGTTNIFNLNINAGDSNEILEEKFFNVIFYKNGVGDLTENDLKFINVIGKGKFSKIYLVQNSLNKEYYAVKSIDKNDIEEYNKDKVEKIVKNLNHNFITNIKLCFETSNRIYFCFEYVQNEDLFHHINYKANNENDNINEEEIKFYSASIILALEYLHKNEIIYRNITSKNILISKDGYIKLTPFSLELGQLFHLKKNIESNISKNEYNPPETFNNESNNSSDFWNLGIIIYEMIYGVPPFYSLDENNLKEMIENNDLKFPENINIPENLKDLIEKLLKKNWEERLGKNGDINEIKNHEFFSGFNFDDLLNKKIESPYKPNLDENLRNKNYEELYNYEDLIKVDLFNVN